MGEEKARQIPNIPEPTTLPGVLETGEPAEDDTILFHPDVLVSTRPTDGDETVDVTTDISVNRAEFISHNTYEELMSWLEDNAERAFMISPDRSGELTREIVKFSYIKQRIEEVCKQASISNTSDVKAIKTMLQAIPGLMNEKSSSEDALTSFRAHVARLISEKILGA